MDGWPGAAPRAAVEMCRKAAAGIPPTCGMLLGLAKSSEDAMALVRGRQHNAVKVGYTCVMPRTPLTARAANPRS